MSTALPFLFLIFKIGAAFQFNDLLINGENNLTESNINFSELDMRVGKLITVQDLVTSLSFYVAEVDVDEIVTRTVVTALVAHYPTTESLENKKVVVVCNVRCNRTKGFDPEAVLLCATDGKKIEILEPPQRSIPGERVTVAGFNSTADKFVKLNHEIFETVFPDFKVNGEKVATYKGVPLQVAGKGFVKTRSLKNVRILEAKEKLKKIK